jgi:ATP-dependent RNA helicase DeaD
MVERDETSGAAGGSGAGDGGARDAGGTPSFPDEEIVPEEELPPGSERPGGGDLRGDGEGREGGDGGPEGGVSEEDLARALRQLGHVRTPELVEDMADVVRRGHPVAALAGEGSGKEFLYALAAVERADPGSPGVQALVLCPTRESAVRAARALHLLGAASGLEALAWLPWADRESQGERPFAQLLAGRPAELLPQVSAGRLKLGDLTMLALDGASALEATGQWEAVSSFLDTLGGEAQKIVTDVRRSDGLDRLITHQLGRARKWPPELFAPGRGERQPSGPPLLCAGADDEEGRVESLARALETLHGETGADRAAVLCPDGPTAHRVAASLAARGLRLTDDPESPGVLVGWGDEHPPEGAACAVFGVPASLKEMQRWLGGASARAAVAGTGELAQLRILARRAGWPLRVLPDAPDPDARDAVEQFRRRVRRRLTTEDDAAEALILEPLLREFGAAPVASALSGLLREAPSGTEGEAGASGAEGARASPTGRDRRPSRGARGGGGREKARRRDRPGSGWARLYISAGERDDVGPGDLVGAITGETSAVGGQIGRIEVRHSYSLVDVDPGVAEEVMEKLSGATIKGREVVARPDRES